MVLPFNDFGFVATAIFFYLHGAVNRAGNDAMLARRDFNEQRKTLHFALAIVEVYAKSQRGD
jgi:hypothetical protein